jgi:hypothetical protein
LISLRRAAMLSVGEVVVIGLILEAMT